MVVNGLTVFGLAYSGCSVTSAVICMTLSLMLHGAVSTGVLASMVDIGPNYAGITLGIVSTVCIIPGFLSPIVVGYITFENQTVTAWQHIHEICAVFLVVCGVLYMWLNDTSVQPWNKAPKPIDNVREIEPLYMNSLKDEKRADNDER